MLQTSHSLFILPSLNYLSETTIILFSFFSTAHIKTFTLSFTYWQPTFAFKAYHYILTLFMLKILSRNAVWLGGIQFREIRWKHALFICSLLNASTSKSCCIVFFFTRVSLHKSQLIQAQQLVKKWDDWEVCKPGSKFLLWCFYLQLRKQALWLVWHSVTPWYIYIVDYRLLVSLKHSAVTKHKPLKITS